MTRTQTGSLCLARADKGYRADAAQFFVAAELCRRKLVAVVTLGNCPYTDILVSNAKATAFCHVQVKAFRPGKKTCSVGAKAEVDPGEAFFWILAGIPEPDDVEPAKPLEPPEYYIVPARVMAKGVRADHQAWAATPGRRGQQRNGDTSFRRVQLQSGRSTSGFDLNCYRNRWDLILEHLERQHLSCGASH